MTKAKTDLCELYSQKIRNKNAEPEGRYIAEYALNLAAINTVLLVGIYKRGSRGEIL